MTDKQIEQLLKDYHWMINSVKMMREGMKDIGQGLTAQYGIESGMPKVQGETSDPVFREVIRRSKHHEKVIGYESRVQIIQERIHVIEEVREAEVLHWILEGKGYSWIARHMSLSERHIRRLKIPSYSKCPKCRECRERRRFLVNRKTMYHGRQVGELSSA